MQTPPRSTSSFSVLPAPVLALAKNIFTLAASFQSEPFFGVVTFCEKEKSTTTKSEQHSCLATLYPSLILKSRRLETWNTWMGAVSIPDTNKNPSPSKNTHVTCHVSNLICHF